MNNYSYENKRAKRRKYGRRNSRYRKSKENKKEKITTNIENEKSFGGGLLLGFTKMVSTLPGLKKGA